MRLEKHLFRDKEKARQLHDFAGLRFGNKVPTDIDAFLDLGNRAFVFVEAKYAEAPLPLGQRLALERLCTACVSETRAAYVLVASHNTPAPEDVDLGAAMVTTIFRDGRWRSPLRELTVREAIDRLLVRHGLEEEYR